MSCVKKSDVERYLNLPSPGMREVVHLVGRVAPLATTVFINGPSGCGKEFVARAIHLLSGRASGPFVPVNCGAIPRDLLESELFGSERGAFTGSIKTRQGLLEISSGGTLFLDEIGDMPLEMQVKLLRVLEERTFTRIGGEKAIKADVRIVCATHRDLEKLVAEGGFREDLFYRINVFPVTIAPLDERPEDIPTLVSLIIERFRAQGFTNVPVLMPEAVGVLQTSAWPGNVRQLRNVLERAGVLYGDMPVDASKVARLVKPSNRIDRKVETDALWDAADGLDTTEEPGEDTAAAFDAALEAELGEAFPHAPVARSAGTGSYEIDIRAVMRSEAGFNLRDYIAQVETEFIKTALQDAGGSVSGAARILGFQRTTLIEKIRKFAIDRPTAA
jgi:sigma-54 specific flagellar transcriptional regulator A